MAYDLDPAVGSPSLCTVILSDERGIGIADRAIFSRLYPGIADFTRRWRRVADNFLLEGNWSVLMGRSSVSLDRQPLVATPASILISVDELADIARPLDAQATDLVHQLWLSGS